ncbi:MAG TPA: hypothetical protein VKB88_33885 [Bryobacteraceae bacterium]|nr:hypothetical protein [Bryobacteraceae bacterium]
MKIQKSGQRLPRLCAIWVSRGHQEKSGRARNCAMTLLGLRRRAFYRPLALTMSVLHIPSISWFESSAGISRGSSAKSWQAPTETTGGTGCGAASAIAIIRISCVDGQPITLFGGLNQFEADAVTARDWLAWQVPASALPNPVGSPQWSECVFPSDYAHVSSQTCGLTVETNLQRVSVTFQGLFNSLSPKCSIIPLTL